MLWLLPAGEGPAPVPGPTNAPHTHIHTRHTHTSNTCVHTPTHIPYIRTSHTTHALLIPQTHHTYHTQADTHIHIHAVVHMCTQHTYTINTLTSPHTQHKRTTHAALRHAHTPTLCTHGHTQSTMSPLPSSAVLWMNRAQRAARTA